MDKMAIHAMLKKGGSEGTLELINIKMKWTYSAYVYFLSHNLIMQIPVKYPSKFHKYH